MAEGHGMHVMKDHLSRRDLLTGCGALLGAGLAAPRAVAAPPPSGPVRGPRGEPFLYCFNTACIRRQRLSIVRAIDITARAGYQAIEPWVDEIDRHEREGGSLTDLAKLIEDRGLTVEGAIGFFEWVADDEARRSRGLEEARRRMEQVARIGGKRIAAPPAGAAKGLDLLKAAERYRTLLEIGDRTGVVPQIEIWGRSPALSRLGEAAFIAIESGHPKACILPDVFHIYRGGSDLRSVRLLSGEAIGMFHLNDYPSDPPRERTTDADRVYPGDGVAPLGTLLRDLRDIGFGGPISLELFNPRYYEMDPFEVAKTGLERMRAAVRSALDAVR